jgi:hypothetical protein
MAAPFSWVFGIEEFDPAADKGLVYVSLGYFAVDFAADNEAQKELVHHLDRHIKTQTIRQTIRQTLTWLLLGWKQSNSHLQMRPHYFHSRLILFGIAVVGLRRQRSGNDSLKVVKSHTACVSQR